MQGKNHQQTPEGKKKTIRALTYRKSQYMNIRRATRFPEKQNFNTKEEKRLAPGESAVGSILRENMLLLGVSRKGEVLLGGCFTPKKGGDEKTIRKIAGRGSSKNKYNKQTPGCQKKLSTPNNVLLREGGKRQNLKKPGICVYIGTSCGGCDRRNRKPSRTYLFPTVPPREKESTNERAY